MILHAANIKFNAETGMGRIACEWGKAFTEKGYEFLHIDPELVKKPYHPLLLGSAFRDYILKSKIKPTLILSHEPLAGFLKFTGVPLVVFSHGVEERNWLVNKNHSFNKLSLKARLLPESVRFYPNNQGFKKADCILLSNITDRNYLVEKGVSSDKIRIFNNGYYEMPDIDSNNGVHLIYNGTWLPRKGVQLIYDAVNYLFAIHKDISLTIIGSSIGEEIVLSGFSEEHRSRIKIVTSFMAADEQQYLRRANVFLLPSFFEGQSLALTQAMSIGLCPVVSDNSGQIDLVKNFQNGLLFKTGDSKDFIQKLDTLISNPSLIKSLGIQARSSVSHLTWKSVTDELISCILLNA